MNRFDEVEAFEEEEESNIFRGVFIGTILVTPFWLIVGWLILFFNE